jgi:hypothetical protein
MLPQNVLYYGQEDALPAPTALRAGSLTLSYENGDLQRVNTEHESIYVAIRDRNWGTIPNLLSNVQMAVGTDSFHITYDVENQRGDIDFAWRATLSGDSQGTICCTMVGTARTTFLRNRIGFCILHPSSSAGDECLVEHVDGTTETAQLPIYIIPDQPVLPFAEMRGLRQHLGNGVQAEMRFEGDIFELEDQRNWTDASYKTFSTPLRLPFPVEVRQGTTVTQSFTLRLHGAGASPEEAQADLQNPRSITLHVPKNALPLPLPPLGLGLASHSQSHNETEIERLRRLNLHHLRVDLRLATPGYLAQLDRAIREAQALGVNLEIALLLSPPPQADVELRQLRSQIERLQPPVGIWLVFPAQEKMNAPSPTTALLAAARQHLADYAPGVLFSGGTNADFIFMNRFRTDPAAYDALAITTNPTVHAIDNSSVMETLAAQATLVKSAQRLAGAKPVLITPVTLKMRHNPYATAAPAPVPPGELPPQVDVRQMALFGAAWTVGSLKYLAESGVASATYYETTGWRGVMETAYGSYVPEKFRALPGTVFPLYHVFADVGEFVGGAVIPTVSSQSLQVDGLALHKAGRLRLLLANLTPELQTVTVTGLPAQVHVRMLDETNAHQAMHAPEEFRASAAETQPTPEGRLTLALRPYGVARVDGQA